MPMSIPRLREPSISSLPNPPYVIRLAWTVTLLVSILPDIVWKTASGGAPSWLLPAKLILLACLIGAGFFWETARKLRLYAIVLIALLAVEDVSTVAQSSSVWRGWFGSPGFGHAMLGIQMLRVAAALLMAGVPALLGFRPREYYLVRGDLDAPAEPVRWLGITGIVSWARLGPISALCISLGTLTFLVIACRPPIPAVVSAVPMLPMVLLLAAMNAFGEEVMYRGALLAPTAQAIGPRHAVLLTAAFFGIGHYFGVPYGIVGVAMSSLLGWFLGKCMVETQGLFWPWFIHFLQDVMIFYFMAMGAVVAGGR